MSALSAALLSNFTKRRFHESYLSFRDDSRVQQLTIMVNLVASFPLVGDPGTKLVKVWDIFQSLSCKSSAGMLACAHFLATFASSVLKPKWGYKNHHMFLRRASRRASAKLAIFKEFVFFFICHRR